MRHMSARLNRFRDEEEMGNGLREVWRVSVEVWPIASPRLQSVFESVFLLKKSRDKSKQVAYSTDQPSTAKNIFLNRMLWATSPKP